MSYDVGSEGDRSDDEHKKIDQKKIDKELNQTIYITITETPTTILFYSPSTKYLNLKNGKYKIKLILNIFLKYRRSNRTREKKESILHGIFSQTKKQRVLRKQRSSNHL